ncbi:Importin subunit alpha [Heracleum sosnowskyi]|uniref:Importin subunit alpha n=1 Tax=Heracleum sosnowskyi TaxID=360622 RepID=A0AAD8GRG0_9APIA|nr:Importin subunit alpha [Heracleum sosnowskyi]
MPVDDILHDRVEICRVVRGETALKKRCECLKSDKALSLSFPDLLVRLLSVDSDAHLEATTQFRRLLSAGIIDYLSFCVKTPPDVDIPVKFVRRFVHFLSQDYNPQLQFEAAWALTNIAFESSENANMVIKHGAVPMLVKLLGSPIDTLREQAVWALGNLAGDSPQFRDLVLDAGALKPLLLYLDDEHAKYSMLKIGTWALLNFCRGNPQPPFDQIKPALPALFRLVHSVHHEVLTDACWALSHLSDGSYERIEAVIEAGFCPRLVQLLGHFCPWVLTSTLRTVGNIATGGDVQIQCIIEHCVLPRLLNLVMIEDHMWKVEKEACRTISNIAAGNKEHIQIMIKTGLFGLLIDRCQNAKFFDIKKEAACAISNATSGSSNGQIWYLVRQNCIKPLCDLLVCPESRIVIACLKGLANILKVGEAEKRSVMKICDYAQLIEEAKGLEKIKNLQSHDNNEISKKAVEILETYWFPYDGTWTRPASKIGEFRVVKVDGRVMVVR